MGSYIHIMYFLTIASLLLPLPSHCADPSPLQDFCVADLDLPLFLNGFPCKNPSDVTSKDFFYEGFKEKPDGLNSYGANITQVTVNQFPALNTLGLSMNRVFFSPGGLNPPHVHPRASELTLILEGKFLVGWVTTDYVLYWKVLTAGELFVIPQGLVHFQLNIGKGNGLFYASFNSQKPGLQIVGNALFNSTPSIPDKVLTKALDVDKSIIDLIKSRFSELKIDLNLCNSYAD
jgi:quercetin dioxygenase-like cupin family protein